MPSARPLIHWFIHRSCTRTACGRHSIASWRAAFDSRRNGCKLSGRLKYVAPRRRSSRSQLRSRRVSVSAGRHTANSAAAAAVAAVPIDRRASTTNTPDGCIRRQAPLPVDSEMFRKLQKITSDTFTSGDICKPRFAATPARNAQHARHSKQRRCSASNSRLII